MSEEMPMEIAADRRETRLEVKDLEVVLGRGVRATRVLHGISFRIEAGTTVGLVGESGSGKSTIAKTVVGVHRPAAGSILFDGEDISAARGRRRTELRRRIQLIPQDPYSSLDPRRSIRGGPPCASIATGSANCCGSSRSTTARSPGTPASSRAGSASASRSRGRSP
jgi:ABC-type dipeptide/oligopeptide/nickel transport system ATPase subunit